MTQVSFSQVRFLRLACEWLALAACGLFAHERIRRRKRRAEMEGKLAFLAETIPIAIARPKQRSVPPAPGDVLPPRESGVLYFLVQGLANKEIATHLGLTVSAVKGTLRRLFAKTNMRTRSQLVKVALEHYRDILVSPPAAIVTPTPVKPAAAHTPAWRPRGSGALRRNGRNRGPLEGRVMLGLRRSGRTD